MDAFRQVYNHDRPHGALAYQVPAARYALSPRSFPETLPEIVYDDEAEVRTVTAKGIIKYQRRQIYLSEALRGLPVGVYPTRIDGLVQVRFCSRTIATVDLRTLDSATGCVTDVPEHA